MIEQRTGEVWVVEDRFSDRYPLYTRGNVGEVFPEVVSPLTWSLYGRAADDGWKDAFVEFGALVPGDFETDRKCIVCVFGGYAYLSIGYNRLFAARTPLVKVEDVDHNLFGAMDAPPFDGSTVRRRPLASLKALRSLIGTLATVETPEVDEDARVVEAWRANLPPLDSRDTVLLDAIRAFRPRFRQLFARHILTSFRASAATSVVQQLTAKHTGDASLANVLVSGLGDVESAAPPRALWGLGRLVVSAPALTAEFDAGLDGLDRRLRQAAAIPDGSPAIERFVVDFDRFLADFGYRGPNEWDLAAQTWDAQPAGALAAIDAMRRAGEGHAPEAQRARLEKERAVATATVRAAVPRLARRRFDKALRAAQVLSRSRERSKSTIIRATHQPRLMLRELAGRVERAGGPAMADFFLLTMEEVPEVLRDPTSDIWRDTLADRRTRRDLLAALVPPFVISESMPDPSSWETRETTVAAAAAGTVLAGIGACPGVATGRARVVLDPFDPRGLSAGEVLVAPITDPSWTPLFMAAEAVVVDVGATMSHAVIVSRELGIPAVVSVTGATSRIVDGSLIEVDGTNGIVRILETPS